MIWTYRMCGRYAIACSPDVMRSLFGYREMPNFPPRYNVAPTQPIPIVRLTGSHREFALVRWGFLPAWVKDPANFSLLINARGETVNERPAFRNAMKRRRCLIPADGYYEWKREAGMKRPHLIRLRNGGPFAFAGLWECWIGPNGEEVDTAAIVTTVANTVLQPIHNRMPAIVSTDAFDLWLDCARVDERAASALIAPAPDDWFEAYEISPAVNRAENDGPEIQEPHTTTDVAVMRSLKKDERQPSLF